MSKKIPKCAYCGKDLKAPRVMFDFSWCPGGPRIGWHQDCIDKETGPAHNPGGWYDAAVYSETGGESMDPPPKGEHAPVVVEVFRRGVDRVTIASGRGCVKRFNEAMDNALKGDPR
jgi:hypothetical protein